MRTIELTRMLWTRPAPYYQLLVDCTSDKVIAWPARGTPNIQRPGRADAPNLEEYPVLAQGTYHGLVMKNGFHGKTAILLEGGGDVPAFQAANPRNPHQGRMIRGAWIHEGQKEGWPGSAACITLAPGGARWIEQNFINHEKILVVVPGAEPGLLLEDVGDYKRT